jgi:aryl-alcohol dehydrogenase-like predicted oxidoreductase
MALAFVSSRPFVTSNIIGATTLAQLKTDIAAALLKLSEAVLKDIEEIHLSFPNSCP